MTVDERAIRELIATWMRASMAGDVDTVLSLMADDVVFMVAGQEPFDKEAFAAATNNMRGTRLEGTSVSASCGCWVIGHSRAPTCR
jgi:uncharacterized protein (TIGR02246 family)